MAAHYPPDSHVLNLLPLAMRMAGPREAGLHMVIGKNFGCTHFVIGHDHGSPGYDSLGKPFYPDDTASLAAGKASKELGIDIITFEEMVYLPFVIGHDHGSPGYDSLGNFLYRQRYPETDQGR